MMFPPKKILFPVDLSSRTHATARMVRELARECGAEVKVLHAINQLDPKEQYFAKGDEARKRLDAMAAEDLAGCDLAVEVTTGDPAATILAVAQQGGSDLIMMATHGHGNFVRALVGSVTDQVLRAAPCPVWTTAHLEAHPEEHRIRSILCAVDFGSRSSLVLETAVRAAEFWEAGLRLVHVLELSHSSTKDDWTKKSREEARAAVEEQLRQLAVGARGKPIVEALVDGSPAQEVIAAAERCHADLIVVGRTAAIESERRIGSTVYGLITGSDRPVLSV